MQGQQQVTRQVSMGLKQAKKDEYHGAVPVGLLMLEWSLVTWLMRFNQ